MDKVGRKNALFITAVSTCITTAILAASQNIGMFIAFRFIGGFTTFGFQPIGKSRAFEPSCLMLTTATSSSSVCWRTCSHSPTRSIRRLRRYLGSARLRTFVVHWDCLRERWWRVSMAPAHCFRSHLQSRDGSWSLFHPRIAPLSPVERSDRGCSRSRAFPAQYAGRRGRCCTGRVPADEDTNGDGQQVGQFLAKFHQEL